LRFRHGEAFPLCHLQILQPAQYIVLNYKVCFHAKMGSFFDGERFRLESLDGARSSQVDGDVRTTFDFESERLDHAAPLVFGVDCKRRRVTDTEGCFPAVK